MCSGGGDLLRVAALGALAATGLGLAGVGPLAAGGTAGAAGAAGAAGMGAGATGLTLGTAAPGLSLGATSAAGFSPALAASGFDAGLAGLLPAGAGAGGAGAGAVGGASAPGGGIMSALRAGAQLAPLASLAMMAGGNPKMPALGSPTPMPQSQAAQTPAPNIFKKKLSVLGDPTQTSGVGGVANTPLGRATVLGR